MTTKEDYMEKLRLLLDEWNAEIQVLRADAQRIKGEDKAEFEKRIENLQKKCKIAEEKMEQIRQSDNVGWEELKGGAEEIWDGLKQLFKDTKSEFSKGLKEGKNPDTAQ